jgi:hypothetical protein
VAQVLGVEAEAESRPELVTVQTFQTVDAVDGASADGGDSNEAVDDDEVGAAVDAEAAAESQTVLPVAGGSTVLMAWTQLAQMKPSQASSSTALQGALGQGQRQPVVIADAFVVGVSVDADAVAAADVANDTIEIAGGAYAVVALSQVRCFVLPIAHEMILAPYSYAALDAAQESHVHSTRADVSSL